MATEETQSLRRRIISVAVSQIGLSENLPDIPADKMDVIPWRAIKSDWDAVIVPGYKLLFNLIKELLYCFDVTLLRETLEFILVVCGVPYSAAFTERLCDLLRAVAMQSKAKFRLHVVDRLF